SYPWIVLTVGTVAYLASLPFGAAKAQAMARAEAGSAVAKPPADGADEKEPD
uniref:hypothetical protein n=1 Tax=Acinetobacter baumannii TaxID=470 RepID=UPI001C09723F